MPIIIMQGSDCAVYEIIAKVYQAELLSQDIRLIAKTPSFESVIEVKYREINTSQLYIEPKLPAYPNSLF